MPAHTGRLFILDANALMHRAWHALPPLTSPDGQVVNALYGMLMACLKLIEDHKPDAFVACWDTEAPTFRHVAYAAYKATRAEQPDELYAQVPLIKEGLALLGIESLELDGFEADDLLGTLALKQRKAGWEVVIVTGDRDALQLIRPGIQVMAFKKGVSETMTYDEAVLLGEYGLTPGQFLEYKAMRGDPSDNIPGVKGIGEKGATELLRTYGDLKGILKAAKDPKSALGKSQREKLLAAETELPAIMELVRIKVDVPIDYTPAIGSLLLRDQAALTEFLQRYGFKSLITRLEKDEAKKIASEAARSLKETKAATRPKSARVKLRGFEEVRLETEAAALAALDKLKTQEEIVVQVSSGASDSLFAQSVDGFVLATSDTGYFFPSSIINKSAKLKTAMCQLLTDPAIHKAAHDAKAQMKALAFLGCNIKGWSFDTLLGAYLLTAGERNHDLEHLAFEHAGLTLAIQANAQARAQAVVRLKEPLREALREARLVDVFARFELPLVPVLFAMEQAGIKIDTDYFKKLSLELTEDLKRIEEKMIKLVGKAFNPSSPTQLAQILFEDLKLPTKGVKRGKTGYSTAAPELEKLRGTHPLIELIEEQRELSKLLTTYVDTLPGLADKQGRIHATFNQAITATGRLSSTEPNLQNIPIRTELGRRIRRGFVAKEGYRLVSCDYSQIELRIVAALAKDERMLEAFRAGEDIHTATAANILKIPIGEVTKEQRRIAKAINFGLIFGQGPQGLSQVAGISFADAKKFIAAYFEVYEGIRRYMEETKAMARSLGYVETLFGRRRLLPEIQSMLPQLRAQAERMAINMPVQGTESDLVKLAMTTIYSELPLISADSRLLLQVHDELVFEIPDAEVKSVARAIKNIMESVEKIGVPIVVDVKQGLNWDEMEQVNL